MKRIITFIALCVLLPRLQAQVSFGLSSTLTAGIGAYSVTAADVNGDGWVDLICANSVANTLSVLTNNHSGGFVLASSPGVGNDPVSVIAADVNGDGWVDLICANKGNSTLSVLTNNRSGGFVLSSSPVAGSEPYGVVAADVNGDGWLDLICANIGSDTLTVLTNNGSGGFVLSSTLSAGHNPNSVTAADVNGDGWVDLICANDTDRTLSVFTNNGHGGFVLSSSPAVGRTPDSVMPADVNGDGWVDLVCANYTDGTLSVLTNNRSGGFVLSSSPAVGYQPYWHTAADVNGDGWVDLISANAGSNSLSVLTNNGSGGFVLAATLAVGSSPFSVVAADVNGDGRMDLISANNGNNTLTVWTNATFFPTTNPPVISAQPGGQTNLVGSTAMFSVSASGGPFTYQWQLAGTNLPAATNNPLVLTNLALSQAGNYDVVIANANGSITSSPAILDVRSVLITVNGQPAAPTMTAAVSATVAISGGYPGGFIFYSLDGSTPTAGSTLYQGPFTVTNSVVLQAIDLSSDFSQSAYSAPVTLDIIPVYNLQTSVVGDGTVNVNPPSGPYASNSVVTLTASAAQYWAFDHWTGNASGSLNPLNLTIDSPLNVQAVFVQTAYPLTVSTPGAGSVTVNGQVIAPATFYPSNSVVTVTATASNGWVFVGWLGSASGTNNPLSVTMSQTNTIQAIFGTVVGTSTAGGGSIVLSQPNPIPFGTTLTASAVPNAGNYFVTWSGAASGTNAPTTISVTSTNPAINALFTTLPAGGYSLSVIVLGNGSVGISPQQSYYGAGANVTLNASATNAGTSFYGWTGAVAATNDPLMVVISTNEIVQANFAPLPAVNISPPNLIVYGGSNAVLTAIAAGLPPLSYQWQDSEGLIAGATNDSYTIIDAQATNSDSYSVIVSNSFGSVTSAVATVTVVFPPSISIPPMPQNLAVGANLTLAVLASGTSPLSYQWQNSEGAIVGATNSSLTFDPAETNETDNYFVIVSNSYGVATSQVASVFVYLPVSITSQPASLVVPALAPASFSVAASGFPAPTSYQWTLNGTNLMGATSNTFSISHVGLANLGNYEVFVGNGYSSTNSDIAMLNMSPSLIAPFGGATTIWGQSAVLSVGAIGSGQLSYQWYMNGVAVAGATNATLDFASVQFTNGGLYSVVVSNSFGVVTNVAAQVVVNPAGVSLGFSPTLTINGVVGYTYIIQSAPNLTNTNAWVTLTNLTLTQPVQTWVDTNVDASSPFYPVYYYRVLPGQ